CVDTCDCRGGCPTGYECVVGECRPSCPKEHAVCGSPPNCLGDCPSREEQCIKQDGRFTCECIPSCAGKGCGADNGCGSPCTGPGLCPSGQECMPDGDLIAGASDCCKASCEGKECGDPNGCGGTCDGRCPSGELCLPRGAGQYFCSCDATCSGKACGDYNGCGQRCDGSC